jgi:hypothetical protein
MQKLLIKLRLLVLFCAAVLSVLTVSVLAIGPRFAGSNQADKIRSTPSFGGEVNLSSPCRMILHVKEPFDVRKRYYIRQQFISFSTSSPFVS